eukprot:RCo045142
MTSRIFRKHSAATSGEPVSAVSTARRGRGNGEPDEYERAAQAIWEADVLLIVAGAGFYESADMTAFVDPRCDATLIQSNPDRFYGFWGSFFNRYSDRPAHDGYAVLRKWRDNFFDAHGVDHRKRQTSQSNSRSAAAEEGDAALAVLARCYVITSTIDGSFLRAGFHEDEVLEMRGNIHRWQCWMPCKPQSWPLPDPRFRFEIDSVTQEAKPTKYVVDTRPPTQPMTDLFVAEDSDEEYKKDLARTQPTPGPAHSGGHG